MDFGSLTKEGWIEELKCTVCSNYLSYFPIHTSSDGKNKNVCGRCPLPGEGYIRNKIYEVASQQTVFPCRYKSEGCCEVLIPKSVPHHEEACEYRTIKCLTQPFTECKTKVSCLNMTKHCHEQHARHFLKDGEFEIDVTGSHIYDYFLEHNNQVLIFFGTFDHRDKLFRFILYYSCYHKLKFSCGSKTLSVKWEASGNIQEIFLDSLMAPQQLKISAKIHLEPKTGNLTIPEDLNRQLSNLWKCSSCSNYAPKFYRKNSCPYCRSSFHSLNTSIYTKLDGLGTLVKFSCKNANIGCNFSGQLSETEAHQKFCQFDSQACPLQTFRSCRWTGQGRNLKLHILHDHRPLVVHSSTMTLNIPYDYYNSQPKTECFVLYHGQYFFNFIYLQQGQKFYWIVQMMGEFKDVFRYEIQICDDSQKLPQFVLTQCCRKQSTKQELMSDLRNHCYMSLDQIQTCVNVQKGVSFKLRILKK